MIELLFDAIANLGAAGAQNALVLAGESAVKRLNDFCSWKKIIVGTGEFYLKHEKEENAFFDDLRLVLSKENLSQIAKDLKAESGYELKHRLYKALMQLMSKYEIPYETAESYSLRIMYTVLEQLKIISPQKYEHYFLQEWRDEQEKIFFELQTRINKMSNDIAIYNRELISIESSGQMDVSLRKSTFSPSIGIDFFIVDDEHFRDEFEVLRYEELVFIKGRCREESIYCILNELWRLNDKRPIYVVRNLESWKKLQTLDNSGNIYIPWFYADEIVAIENNTNIFVINDDTPTFGKSVLELRPRTRDTILKCLQDAGLEYNKAYSLVSDTHGLYSQMKKQLFKGEYFKNPDWLNGLSEKAKKTCLLVGSWEEIDGDKLIIESLYEGSYDNFIEEILPYSRGEDPLIYMVKRRGAISYYLASAENVWSYLNVLTHEKIWDSFISVVFDVINESEELFTYDNQERLIAKYKGESLFWSETIRKGMLKTLLIKAVDNTDKETQLCLNQLVKNVLKSVKTEKQWIYISNFWLALCEISPVEVLNRLDSEWNEDTGLISLFQNQSSDFIFGKNSYIDILWGIEQLLSQRDYFWSSYRWLLKLDSQQFEYKSNSPKDVFSKLFCTWMNFSPLQTAEEKIYAAELAFKIDSYNAWEHLYASIDSNGRSIFGELSYPKYREHCTLHSVKIAEMQKTNIGYLNLLLQHMDFSVEHWKKVLHISSELSQELRDDVFKQLSYDLTQMSDESVMKIKNEIRNIIYRHRFFASSGWSMSEDYLFEYEKLLESIDIHTPEYEYVYLFQSKYEISLLHPIPNDMENSTIENETAKESLIKEKILEFKERGYDLSILAKNYTNELYSSLGVYLAKYWNDGKWDYSIFKCLLSEQTSGQMALEYLEFFSIDKINYSLILEDLAICGYSIEILAKIYWIEANKTKDIPLVDSASEQIKKVFWKNTIYCNECNKAWVLSESKQYATLELYINQVHQLYYTKVLTAEEIFECFEGVEELPHSEINQMIGYHVEQLISVIQDEYINNIERCIRIAQLEIYFSNLLKWDDMKCFHRMIKQSPEIMAQLVAGIFKRDSISLENQPKDQSYIHNLYTLYERAHFCPVENDGEVDEHQLEQWICKYKELLIENDQASLFTATLGRLFSFSPVGTDGHEPCEAVRNMIEKYGDEKLISRYQVAVYNRRGSFSPSAGKSELIIAERFKANGQYLESLYPKTSQIFFGLYEIYKRESEGERIDAENGWY